MSKLLKSLNGVEFAGLLAIMIAIVFLWHTPLVYPLKILVVFFHELSHGLAALVTGGSIKEIRLLPEEGGVCVTAGGNEFLVLSAGYLGSLVWGGLILCGACRSRHDQKIALAIGGLMVVVSLTFIRPFASFGFVFSVVTGSVLILISKKMPEGFNDRLLKIIGLTSCLYAVLDIKSDVLDRPQIPSDAKMLADLTGIPTLVWGLLWIAIATLASLFFLVIACRGKTYPAHRDDSYPRSTQA
jgi:hypothetical protein